MINLKTTFPSDTVGAVVDIQKGRAVIALNQDELDFLANLNTLLVLSNVRRGNEPEPSPVNLRIIPLATTDYTVASETAA